MPGCTMFPPSEILKKVAIYLRSLELLKGQAIKDKNYTVRREAILTNLKNYNDTEDIFEFVRDATVREIIDGWKDEAVKNKFLKSLT